MVDRGELVGLVPHYVAILLLTFLALGFVRASFPGLALWQEFAIVLVLVFLYRPLVQRLGVGPSAWERESRDDVDIGPDPDGETESETDADAGTDADQEPSPE